MIPRIIHYCWFGSNKIPEKQQKYIDEWKRRCPYWEFKLWNEQTFDINQTRFSKSAYELRKYAFVADVARVWALNEFGGVYLDTDVELKNNLDQFLTCEAFSCIETVGIPFTSAVWGSCKNHILLKKMESYYLLNDYSENEQPNTITISNILIKDFGINPLIDINQVGSDGDNTINIFASPYFCLDLPVSFATHHFEDSWSDKEKKHSYKSKIHEDYHLNSLAEEKIKSKYLLKKIAKKMNFKSFMLLLYYYLFK